MMTDVERALLDLLKCGLHGDKPEDPQLSREDWVLLLQKADFHKLLPLIVDCAGNLPSLRRAFAQVPSAVPEQKDEKQASPEQKSAHFTDSFKSIRDEAFSQACRQAIQENEFLNLLLELRAEGLDPLVLKGPICRALYPNPLLRPSVDDDLLIRSDQAAAFHRALLSHNLNADDPAADPDKAWELSYHRPDSPLYIELHKQLFDPDSPAFSGWNSYFEEADARAVPAQIQDVTLRTMCPTDHFLFLLLHAFKHFLHSGFGLRIISDIALFAQAEADRIEFDRICEACGKLRFLRFAAAIFRISEKYLGIPAPAAFSAVETDEGPLLVDVLDAGIHGQDINRLHSANITLQTVSAARQGRARPQGGLRASLFPSAAKLAGKYPFLERRPWLLPAAWALRIGGYLKERRTYSRQVHPTASLRIGRARIELLEHYDIIDR